MGTDRKYREGILRPGMAFESGTVYRADRNRYDIYPEDTVECTEKRCFALSDDNVGRLHAAFLLGGIRDAVLDFGGAVLCMHGTIQPFLVMDCENVTVKNVVLEYERSYHSEFVILEKSEGVLRLRPKENFPCRVEDGCLIPYSGSMEWHNLSAAHHFLMIFDKETGEGVDNPLIMIGRGCQEPLNPPGIIFHLEAEQEEDGAIRLSGNLPGDWKPGMTAIISHATRDMSSCSLICSNEMTIENYRIINGIGMGILGMYCRNLTIRGLKLYQDRLSHGLLSNDGDAMHLVACCGKLDISDCICEGMEDDALNVHSNYYGVERVEGKRLFACRRNLSAGMRTAFKLFGAGDVIAVQQGKSMLEKGRFTIEEVSVLNDDDVVFDLDREPEGLCPGDTIENLSTQPELTIRGCRFGKANSNLRLQTRGKSLIEDCQSSIRILLTGDKDYWYESSPIDGLTIRNCRFTGARGQIRSIPEGFDYLPGASYYHRNVTIQDCTFETAQALTALRTEGIVFSRNVRTGGDGVFRLELEECGAVETDIE